ncbi:amino acid transporter [Halorientalis sp. IM1011]|uniref:APC family permease n=1 Tax=Halorientalis sp. IM1011 TaxID=1932360 RepID=UPI00097CCAFF|nr:APC family permease [Halorientalis sp. IM1011]AQL42035.1 amino acid transporter [Halorientalis sp. IM1011]
MSEQQLGLTEAVSMALGGMIGGGIYAVMGVVAGITTYATWAAFVLAGVVALAAGYSYNALNRLSDSPGGSVTFVQCFTGNTTLAGMTGWTLLFGYIGSMAMYAFAFGEFAVAFGAIPTDIAGVPARPLLSVLAVAGFVGLNVLGARTTGTVENILVAAKVAILLAFGVLGLVYAFGAGGGIRSGASQLTGFGPVVAAAISFVAFQGWQLLFYDQDSIADPVETIRTAVYVAIPVAIVVYLLVGVVTVNLVPQALQSHPHVALKDAASLMARPYGLAALGGTVLSLSALFSTGSAINATLFSAAHFAKGMLSDDLLPDRIGSSDADGAPPRLVVLLGVVTAAFTAVGGLGAITSFASLSFIVVFGAMSYLAFRHRDQGSIHPVPPLVGVVGTVGFFPLMLWNLSRREPNTFYMVVVIAVLVVAVELLYFERETIAREVERFENEIPVGESSG